MVKNARQLRGLIARLMLLQHNKVYNILSLAFAGALLTLAFAPFNCLLLFFLPTAFWIYKIKQAKHIKEATLYGFVFGFVHILSSSYWTIYSFSKVESKGVILGLACLLVIGLVHSITFTITSLLSYRFKHSKAFILIFSIIFASSENIRALKYIAFPWNFFAYTLAEHPHLLQIAFYLGTFGCSLLLTLLAGLLSERKLLHVISSGFIMLLIFTFGYKRLANQPTEQYHANLTLRIVQPNFTFLHNYRPLLQRKMISKLIDLSIADFYTPDTLIVIWPEAAIPMALHKNSTIFNKIVSHLPPNSILISGFDRRDYDYNSNKNIYHNSIVVLDENHEPVFYDKRNLVPFGEFVPGFIANFADAIAQHSGSFSPGRSDSNIIEFSKVPKFAAFICYEIIFSNFAEVKEAEWGLNIVNDFWFDDSIGIYQHLAIAKFKAVELGMPIVRVNNTGITTIINQFGIEQNRLDAFHTTVKDVKLPKRVKGY